MSDDELAATRKEMKALRDQARADRKLFEQAAQVLAEIDRASGLRDDQADILVALRIRVEGKERGSLEDLLSTTEGVGRTKEFGDVLTDADEPTATEWPEVEEKKRDWPEL